MLTEPIEISGGRVAGVLSADGALQIFKGIPYAAPPVGELRWRTPQPPRPWNDVLIADRFGCACVQPLHAPDHFMSQFGFADIPECGLSEHCLFLNIWAPLKTKADNHPVIVWIYGGGHRVGSGSHPVSDGEALARKDTVVVSINYRLGGLGYLAHPLLTAEAGFSGNYACLDVLAALRWVQDNIAAFGGDPQRVTVFGQSAGGALINVLMASPLARGLFQRAIVHSSGRFRGGPMGGSHTLQQAEQDGERFIESLGASSLEQMRALPADKFYGVPRQWNPIVDGYVLRESVQSVFERGEQMPIPLLVGFTRDDATAFPALEWHTQTGLQAHLQQAWPSHRDEIQQLYPYHDDASAKLQSYALRRDITFAYQAWRFAHLHSASSGAPVYLFEFAHAVPLPAELHFHGPQPPAGYGAYHGAELWYVFNTLDAKPWHWTEDDRKLANTMSSCWANFATHAHPSHTTLPQWPAFDAQAPSAMIFDEQPHVGAVSNQAQLNFFSACFNGG